MSVAAAIAAGDVRRRMATRLARAFERQGRDGTAALDARLLLAHTMKVDADRLALRDDLPVDATIVAAAEALVDARIAGVPVARLIGSCEFFGRSFEIGPQTLVPRPDSETVVEAALAFAEGRRVERGPLAVADLGTGSGILIVTVLAELGEARGIGVDVAPGALAVARRNAGRLGLAERARFVVGDWGRALAGGFDVVLANPPYIRTRAIAGLQVEVAAHDPHIALDGGADGLECHRAIIADLDRLLARGGRAFIEIGFDQAQAVAELAENFGFVAVFHRDLGGVERVGELRRAGEVADASNAG